MNEMERESHPADSRLILVKASRPALTVLTLGAPELSRYSKGINILEGVSEQRLFKLVSFIGNLN